MRLAALTCAVRRSSCSGVLSSIHGSVIETGNIDSVGRLTGDRNLPGVSDHRVWRGHKAGLFNSHNLREETKL